MPEQSHNETSFNTLAHANIVADPSRAGVISGNGKPEARYVLAIGLAFSMPVKHP
jgi:hypothetical protein